MVTIKHNHNHKNSPHKKDHDHLWYPPWPWSLSQPPGQEEAAEEEPLPWRSSRWCSGARRSPSLTCSGSPQGLKKELLMMWLSCWSSASSAWIRKVKTCYFKPISGNNNNALMFAICSSVAVKINHKVHRFVLAGSKELMAMKMITKMVMCWRRWMSWTHSVWLEWGLDWIRTAVPGDLFVPGCTPQHLGSILGAANMKSEFFWPTRPSKKHPVANIFPLLAVTFGR